MARSTMQTTDPTLSPTSRAYVVYDKKSGKVLHVHRTITFPNAYKLPETAEAHALRLAGKRGAANAAVLEVTPDEVRGGRQIKVDVKRGALVLSTARRPSSSRKSRSSKKKRRA